VPAVPAGSDDVVTVSGATLISNESEAVAVVPALSLTCTVKLAVPAAAGVPEIVPEALSERPPCRDPDVTDHV
jgi:hypothetical protein